MRRSLFATGLIAGTLVFCPVPASAHHVSGARVAGIVTVEASGHKITVAAHLATRWQALIADFAAHGYRPRRVGCYATGGHVPNSWHYSGAACDFDQRGWGLTVPFMYRAGEIIRAHGFRDGCSFADCGHVDDGLPGRGSHSARRAARPRHGHGKHRHR